MPTRTRALLFLAKTLMFWAKTLLFWAKTLLIPAKISKACGTELLKDQISELPDEIIVHIISLLTLKEAGRTSVLSKRWRYVWAYIPVLNFDASDTLNMLLLTEEDLLEVEKSRYISWVNQVLGSYKGPIVDEFRVRFDISVTSSHIIDNWVKFLMEKRVKKLELDFQPHDGGGHDNCYTLYNLSFFNSLTSLRLACVDVTGEVLQNFINSCPHLENLSVKDSQSLENLEVSGPNLKYLEITLCFEIKLVEIYAPNLVSFKYFGPKISLPFKWTPKLAKLSMGGEYGIYWTNNFVEFSSSLSRLEALRLHLNKSVKYVMKSVNQFPQCKKLQQLEVEINPTPYEDLFCLATMIKAFPNLHKFVLKLDWCELNYDEECDEKEAFHHDNLKIVEIVGFVGQKIDIEFVMHIINICVALEKIVINTCRLDFIGTPWEFEVGERQIKAREQAEKLRTKLKSGIELIIL